MATTIRKRLIPSGTDGSGTTGEFDGGSGGTVIQIGDGSGTSAGEPDGSDIGATGNERPPSERVNGNSPNFVDPAAASGAGRRARSDRGKPRGKRTKSRADTAQATRDISSLLFTIHLSVATMLHSEILAITEDEAKRLGEAITRVTDLYDIQILNERQMAWVQLAIVTGGVYGPRFAALAIKKKKRGEVVQMPAPNANGIAHDFSIGDFAQASPESTNGPVA